ncbi:MAG: TonB family protein [Terracidiphilus sp.]|jgi:protein TonB
MFEDSTFESAGRIHTRSRRWMIAAFTFNSSILLALILIPLIRPEALPRQFVAIMMEVPPAPTAAEPQKPQPARTSTTRTEMDGVRLLAPPRIPPTIATFSEPEPPSLPDTGMIGGSPNGPGVPGGVFPGPSVRPVVRPEPRGRMRVSSGVEDALLIRKILPVYPAIGQAAHVEGTVVLEASISKSGTIENLRVASGPPILRQAALDAVQNWRYRPYLLDGEPVEVETTINVIFTLSR